MTSQAEKMVVESQHAGSLELSRDPLHRSEAGRELSRAPLHAPEVPAAEGRGGFLALVGCLATLAAVLRCDHLDDVSYIFDEGFCWKMISFPAGEIWRRVAMDNHPPLYFYLLWTWSKVFGDSPSALRGMSVLFGVASVIGAYLLAREIASSRIRENSDREIASSPIRENSDGPEFSSVAELAGLTAAGLAALSPLHIDWSQQVRMYTLGAALSAFSSWLLLRATRRAAGLKRDWAWYAATASLLLYTHYYGLFIVAGQFLYAAGWAMTAAPWRGLPSTRFGVAPLAKSYAEGEAETTGRLTPPARLRWTPPARLRWMAGAFGAVGLSWLPWLPQFLRHREQVEQGFWTRPFGWDQMARACFQTCAVSWRDNLTDPAALACVGLVAIALPAGMIAARRPGLQLVGLAALTTLWGTATASLSGRNIVSARYFIFAHLLLLCGVAVVLCGLRPRVVRAVMLSAALAASGWLCWRHAERRAACAERPGVIQAMAYLRDVRRGGEPIVVANPMLQIVAAAYASPEEKVRVLSRSASFPFFQGSAVMRDADFITPDELDQEGAQTLWVIDAARWTVGTCTVKLPDPWVDVEEERFAEWTGRQSEIVVRRCLLRPSRL